jgi:hypothetical protein
MANATSVSLQAAVQDLPRTEIKQTEFGEALFTVDAVLAGTLVLSFDLDPLHVHPAPTRFSVQVGKDLHLDTPGTLFQWLQHEEEPSMRADTGEKLNFFALRDMEAGALLSFNYNTTEWKMATPFTCGMTGIDVSGFSNLDLCKQRFLASEGLIVPHVYSLWREEKQAHDAARMAKIVDAWKLDRSRAMGRERGWSLEATGPNGGDCTRNCPRE